MAKDKLKARGRKRRKLKSRRGEKYSMLTENLLNKRQPNPLESEEFGYFGVSIFINVPEAKRGEMSRKALKVLILLAFVHIEVGLTVSLPHHSTIIKHLCLLYLHVNGSAVDSCLHCCTTVRKSRQVISHMIMRCINGIEP